MDSRAPSPARLPHGLPFLKFVTRDIVAALALLLAIGIIALQFVAMLWVFSSRLSFGSKFDKDKYNDFATIKSEASILETLGRKNLDSQDPVIIVQDDVSKTVAKAGEEFKQVRAREDEFKIVQDRTEEKADECIQKAEASIKAGMADAALQQLLSAVQAAPEYLPAIRKLATFYEGRQDFARARFQWEKAAALAKPLSSEMEEVQKNLERMKKLAAANEKSNASQIPSTLHLDPIAIVKPSLVQIVSVEKLELTPEDKQQLPPEWRPDSVCDIRFKVRVTLLPKETIVNPQSLKVTVDFFDRSRTSEGTIIPIKVFTSDQSPKEPWAPGVEKVLSRIYMREKGYFQKNARNYGGFYEYCGFVTSVYYNGELQNSQASPTEALKKFVRK